MSPIWENERFEFGTARQLGRRSLHKAQFSQEQPWQRLKQCNPCASTGTQARESTRSRIELLAGAYRSSCQVLCQITSPPAQDETQSTQRHEQPWYNSNRRTPHLARDEVGMRVRVKLIWPEITVNCNFEEIPASVTNTAIYAASDGRQHVDVDNQDQAGAKKLTKRCRSEPPRLALVHAFVRLFLLLHLIAHIAVISAAVST